MIILKPKLQTRLGGSQNRKRQTRLRIPDFYVFINVGGLIAPFIAPVLRQWWLGVNGFILQCTTSGTLP